jgi:hypothetical protein
MVAIIGLGSPRTGFANAGALIPIVTTNIAIDARVETVPTRFKIIPSSHVMCPASLSPLERSRTAAVAEHDGLCAMGINRGDNPATTGPG